jgi:hypothetical protein
MKRAEYYSRGFERVEKKRVDNYFRCSGRKGQNMTLLSVAIQRCGGCITAVSWLVVFVPV